MAECIFCQISNQLTNPRSVSYPIFSFPIAISKYKDYIALLEIRPFIDGHTIVMPIHHYKSNMDIPNGSFFEFCTQVERHLKAVRERETRRAYDVQIIMFNDRIEHAHAHLIPIPVDNMKIYRSSYYEYQNIPIERKHVITPSQGETLQKRFKMNFVG